MKKRIIYILVLVVLIVFIVVLRMFTQTDNTNKKIEIVKIEPVENSQVLASTQKLEIVIYFSGEIREQIDNLKIVDNFGLNFEKELVDSTTVKFSTSFGKEIMAIEELKIELFRDEELIKGWSYEIPLDSKAMGKIVEAEVEEKYSFIPSEEDIKYFSDEDTKTNQEQPLWKLLPYETDKYKINHYIDKLKLVVYLKGETKKEEVENEIRNWIKSNGGNEKEHTIEYRN